MTALVMDELDRVAMADETAREQQQKRSRQALHEFDRYRFVDHGDRLTVISPKGVDYQVVRGKCDCPDFTMRCDAAGIACKHLEMSLLWRDGLRPESMVQHCSKCEGGRLESSIEHTPGRGYLIFWTCDACGDRRTLL